MPGEKARGCGRSRTRVAKPVVPLANRPFITYMLDWLEGHGFDDIVMSCGFLAEGVREVLGSGDRGGIRIRYVEETEPLGTAGPVKLAEPMLDERFAVLNGDILTDIDLSSVVGFHEARGARVTLTLTPVDDPSSYGVIVTDDDGAVEAFIEKPQGKAPSNLINAGIYVLEREVVGEIPAGRAVSFEREVFPSLVGHGLYGIEREGYWLDIGTLDRYLQATRDILSGAVETAVQPGFGPGTQADPKALVFEPGLTGPSCEIAAEAELGPDVTLGDRCTVGPGAVVRDSALHDGVTVGEGAEVVGSIVGSGVEVPAGRARRGRDRRLSADPYEISTDVTRLDRALIHRFLHDDSYWARGVPRDVVDRAIDNSLCFGLYHGADQVGFARVVTDRAAIAYLADVFVLPDAPRPGPGKAPDRDGHVASGPAGAAPVLPRHGRRALPVRALRVPPAGRAGPDDGDRGPRTRHDDRAASLDWRGHAGPHPRADRDGRHRAAGRRRARDAAAPRGRPVEGGVGRRSSAPSASTTTSGT